jgi:hypothetical protein
MEGLFSSKMSVDFHKTMEHCIPGGRKSVIRIPGGFCCDFLGFRFVNPTGSPSLDGPA